MDNTKPYLGYGVAETPAERKVAQLLDPSGPLNRHERRRLIKQANVAVRKRARAKLVREARKAAKRG